MLKLGEATTNHYLLNTFTRWHYKHVFNCRHCKWPLRDTGTVCVPCSTSV